MARKIWPLIAFLSLVAGCDFSPNDLRTEVVTVRTIRPGVLIVDFQRRKRIVKTPFSAKAGDRVTAHYRLIPSRVALDPTRYEIVKITAAP